VSSGESDEVRPCSAVSQLAEWWPSEAPLFETQIWGRSRTKDGRHGRRRRAAQCGASEGQGGVKGDAEEHGACVGRAGSAPGILECVGCTACVLSILECTRCTAWRVWRARRSKDGGHEARRTRTEYGSLWRARRGVTLAQVFDLDLTRTEPRKRTVRERKRERTQERNQVSREFTFKLTSCYFVCAVLLVLLAYSFRSNLCLRSHTAQDGPTQGTVRDTWWRSRVQSSLWNSVGVAGADQASIARVRRSIGA
jgi:hypothetical protein